MGSKNLVILLGNLGADPELRYTTNQTPVCNFNIATTESWTGNDGQKQEKTEWHRIIVWGKLAENCSKYLAKGRSVLVEGKLQTRKWTDKENVERYTTEIVAHNVTFVGAKPKEDGEGQQQGGGRPAQQQSKGQSKPQTQQEEPASFGGGFGGPETPGLDDIPFMRRLDEC